MISFYKKNIINIFFKNILIVSIFFLSLVIILNVLEEITFFKDLNVNLSTPIFLTLLNIPSVLFEIFPFVFLIGTMSFFIEILDRNELIIYKSYGLSNLNIINTIIGATFLIGILLVLIFYNISSNLKFAYFDIKNGYSKDDKYLAVITANGLWIKDQKNGNINIISAEKISVENLDNVLITQFDNEFNFIKLIEIKKVNIKNKTWILESAKITQNNISIIKQESILFKTNFDYKIISTLFSNLSSLDIIKLYELKKNYKSMGYSTTEISGHLLYLYSFPFYLSIMVCIASILMLNIGHNRSRIFYLIAGVLISVLIYYMNYIFSLLIESQKIPFVFSVWFPQFLLLLCCLFGMVRINER